MTDKPDGGPAFPGPLFSTEASGMSKREVYAKAALMSPLMASKAGDTWGWPEYARAAFAIADAMLKAGEA